MVVKFIEVVHELVKIDLFCLSNKILSFIYLTASSSKRVRRSQRNPSYLLSILINIITVISKELMKIRVQLVENSPLHRVPSIFLNIYKTQFIFNVIPTLLRHRKKHKINLYSSSHIFFTKNNIEAFGGLPNYLLFRSGSEHSDQIIANKIFLYGDDQLTNYFDQMRFKLGYKSLRFSHTSWRKDNYKLGVESLSLFDKMKNDPKLPTYFAKSNEYLTSNCSKSDYFDSRAFISTMKTRYISIPCKYFHMNLIDIYPAMTKVRGTSYTHYFCIFPKQRKGIEFNLQKFIEQTKITKAQKIKQLQTKGTMQYQGKTHKRQDFLYQEDTKPGNILIFHYSDENSIEEILKNEIFKNYFENKNLTSIIVHIVENEELLNSDIFGKFIKMFERDTQHYWYNSKIGEFKEERFFEDNLLELKLWSEVFPNHVKNIQEGRLKHYENRCKELILSRFPDLRHLFHQRINNFLKNDYAGHQFQERVEARPKTPSIDLLRASVIEHRSQIDTIKSAFQESSHASFKAKAIILGTSSSIPTVNRNISGVLVMFDPTTSFLLDCGEQTLEQITNHFSPEEYTSELLKIKVIFISHIHSDHNLGILSLISERQKIMKQKGSKQKVYLILPFNVYHWYVTYIQLIQDLSSSCQVLFTQILVKDSTEQQPIEEAKGKSNQSFLKKSKSNSTLLEDRFFSELQNSAKSKQLVSGELPNQKKRLIEFNQFLSNNGYKQFTPVRAQHCPQSFGVVIQNNNFKVSYSGDTRPSDRFKEAAKNSDLMIHEATFNDEEATKAELSKHSTVQQAVQIGFESNSRHLALTHFSNDFRIPSQLYKKKKLEEYFKSKTIFSFDHLQIPLKDPRALPSISRLISKLSELAGLQKGGDDNIDS